MSFCIVLCLGLERAFDNAWRRQIEVKTKVTFYFIIKILAIIINKQHIYSWKAVRFSFRSSSAIPGSLIPGMLWALKGKCQEIFHLFYVVVV
jgi:hypothetical protein